jgi:hypothetical protein
MAHRSPELLVRWIDLAAYLLACAALFAFRRRAAVSPIVGNLTLAALAPDHRHERCERARNAAARFRPESAIIGALLTRGR